MVKTANEGTDVIDLSKEVADPGADGSLPLPLRKREAHDSQADDSRKRSRQNITSNSSNSKLELPSVHCMKVREIKEELERNGISTANFLDKSDLTEALAKARADGLKPKQEKSSPSVSAPIKLFATKDDVAERQRQNEKHPCWTECHTLREFLGIDSYSIEWLVVANYMIDFDYLLEEVPELISVPCTTFFYGTAESLPESWKQAAPGADFKVMRPSDPPGSTNPLKYPVPYGVHHSKIFLIGFADGRLRIVIHTANIRYSDIHLKTQAAYYQDFPLKTRASTSTCNFEEDLCSYFETYNYQEQRCWFSHSSPGAGSETLLTCLRKYDFSSALVALVASSPGYHRLDDTAKGHLRVRDLIAANCASAASNRAPGVLAPVVCQFSSIGSLTEKYLKDLWSSMDVVSACRPKDVRPGTQAQVPLQEKLKLVYPTVEEIRVSVQGYFGGGSVPGTLKNVSKPFLRRLYHRWSPCADAKCRNYLWKPHNVPHIKTYYQLRAAQENEMEWFVVASHNLSKAAWGEVQNTARGRRHFIRHWELGVFVTPGMLQCDRLVPHGSSNANFSGKEATIPLPYQWSPELYHPTTDTPWAWDQTYPLPDRFGRKSCF